MNNLIGLSKQRKKKVNTNLEINEIERKAKINRLRIEEIYEIEKP